MALILDTSAVIGWVELKDTAVIDAIRTHSRDGSPRIHSVTIGELERGGAQAPDETIESKRRATLRFAREQLAPIALEPDGDQPEVFGRVAAAVSRKISHNDTWIVAAAITEHRGLLTQDSTLSDQVTRATTAKTPLRTWLSLHEDRLDVVHVPRPST